MRDKIINLETHHKKTLLVERHFEEGSGHQHTPRMPNETDNFKALGRKTECVKDAAVTVVIEMCKMDRKDWKDMGCDDDGLGLIDLDELHRRVLKNVREARSHNDNK